MIYGYLAGFGLSIIMLLAQAQLFQIKDLLIEIRDQGRSKA